MNHLIPKQRSEICLVRKGTGVKIVKNLIHFPTARILNKNSRHVEKNSKRQRHKTPLTDNAAEGSISLGGVSLSESRHHSRGCLSLSLGIVCLPIIRFKEIECLINFYFLANLDAHTH